MAKINITFRYLVVGTKAPKTSRFKGIITPTKIFGNAEKADNDKSWFGYTGRVSAKDKNSHHKNEYFDDIFSYTGRSTAKNDDYNDATFTDIGYLNDPEKRNLFIDKSKLSIKHDGSCVYDMVISFNSFKDMNEYGIYTTNDWAKKVYKLMPKIANKLNINPSNLSYWFDFHNKPEHGKKEIHPHIHLSFFEKERTKIIGKDGIRSEALKAVKREVIKYLLLDNVQKELYQKLDLSKKQIRNNIKNISFNKYAEIINFIIKLPSTGRLQYNSIHIKPYRAELDILIDKLLKDDKLKKDYDRLLNIALKYDEIINRNNNAKLSNAVINEDKKLRLFIASKILSLKKDKDLIVGTFNSNIDINEDNIDDKVILYSINNEVANKQKEYRYYQFNTNKAINEISQTNRKRINEIEKEIELFFKESMEM